VNDHCRLYNNSAVANGTNQAAAAAVMNRSALFADAKAINVFLRQVLLLTQHTQLMPLL